MHFCEKKEMNIILIKMKLFEGDAGGRFSKVVGLYYAFLDVYYFTKNSN